MSKTKYNWLAFSMIAMGAFSRVIPHPPNWTAVAGMALFAGATLQPKWLAFLTPCLALLLADLALGWHNTMLYVYAAMLVPVFLGLRFLNSEKPQPLKIASVSLVSSLVFFAVTNFGVWASEGMMYPKTLEGLKLAYLAGIPYLTHTVFSDLFFSGVFFGGYELVRRALAKAWLFSKN